MKAYKKTTTRYFKIIQEKNSNNYTYTISNGGKYLIELVGAGGGGSHKYANNTTGSGSGASGGYFKGIFQLNTGDVLSFTFGVGGAGREETTYTEITASSGTATTLSINGTLSITANGGGGGYVNGVSSYGQVVINNRDKIVEMISTSGINGSYVRAGAYGHPAIDRTLSPFTNTNTGYGSGGGYNSTNGASSGANGAMRIATVSENTSSNYDYYEDITTYKLPKINEKYYGIGG